MPIFQKCTDTQQKYIAVKHQQIMDFIYKNGQKITYNQQKIYKNRFSFNRSMRQLKRAGFIDSRVVKQNNNFCNEYFLLSRGAFFVEEILENFIKSNLR
jgi:hypothetical protein